MVDPFAGALRSYRIDQNALPDAPLIAMVPVNLRTEGDADGGNVVAGVLCNLATDQPDPAKRLEAIKASMRDNKKVLTQLPRGQATALTVASIVAPAALASLPGIGMTTLPTFNIAVSNVPGMQIHCT